MRTEKNEREKEYTALELLSEALERYHRMQRLKLMAPIVLIIGALSIFMLAIGVSVKATILISILLIMGIALLLWLL